MWASGLQSVGLHYKMFKQNWRWREEQILSFDRSSTTSVKKWMVCQRMSRKQNNHGSKTKRRIGRSKLSWRRKLSFCYAKMDKAEHMAVWLLLGELHLLQETNFAAAASYFVGLLPFGPSLTKLCCCWFIFLMKLNFCCFWSIV